MVRPRPPKRARPVITVRPQPWQEVVNFAREIPRLFWWNSGRLHGIRKDMDLKFQQLMMVYIYIYISNHIICTLVYIYIYIYIYIILYMYIYIYIYIMPCLFCVPCMLWNHAPPSTRSRIRHRRNHACGCPRCQWHPGMIYPLVI